MSAHSGRAAPTERRGNIDPSAPVDGVLPCPSTLPAVTRGRIRIDEDLQSQDMGLHVRLREWGLDPGRFAGRERPLVVVHVATTGPRTRNDRIVGVVALKLAGSTDASRRKSVNRARQILPEATAVHRIAVAFLYSRRVNPGVPILPEATAVHGITDELVADRPGFATIVPTLLDFLDDSDIEGLDTDFDLQMLGVELFLASSEFRAGTTLRSGAPRIREHERSALKRALCYVCERAIRDFFSGSARQCDGRCAEAA